MNGFDRISLMHILLQSLEFAEFNSKQYNEIELPMKSDVIRFMSEQAMVFGLHYGIMQEYFNTDRYDKVKEKCKELAKEEPIHTINNILVMLNSNYFTICMKKERLAKPSDIDEQIANWNGIKINTHEMLAANSIVFPHTKSVVYRKLVMDLIDNPKIQDTNIENIVTVATQTLNGTKMSEPYEISVSNVHVVKYFAERYVQHVAGIHIYQRHNHQGFVPNTN